MTIVTKRIALAVAASAIALGVTAGRLASAQNTNQDPRLFSGPGVPGVHHRGRGGPGGTGGLWGSMGPGGPLDMLRMLGLQLNLTDAQKEQIKNIAESRRGEWMALAERGRAARQALAEAIAADAVDETLIRSKSAELGAVQTDIAVAAARTRAEVWPLLTPEQQAQLKKMQADLIERGRSSPRPRAPR